jgi:hypothetical protein
MPDKNPYYDFFSGKLFHRRGPKPGDAKEQFAEAEDSQALVPVWCPINY